MKTIIVRQSTSAIEKAVSVLGAGGLIIYPTETCYGLGADATNKKAVAKVFRAKGRDADKKIAFAVSSLQMAKKYFMINDESEKLVKAFMPGPLTLVVNGDSFRIPSNKFALELIEKLGRPITATSANLSGQEPIYNADEIISTFAGNVDLIIDARNLPVRKASTVFDVDSRKILRDGQISEQRIIKVLAK